ncbi:unnamed protein product [Paramecium sonneborni]|uniref:Pirin n=1 Tax=Paramecium sonneborni TaxID=65129 RepID=A0A8S1NSZ5_9CILI|nr:unnamed protein product [Paramecium sonneborni]
MSRRVLNIFTPPTVPEGQGAQVIRIIGNNNLSSLNPFMMLDPAFVKLPAGFPDHPHKGFETVSYLLKGSIYHEDSKGFSGHLQPEDIQWMIAGKGVMHTEMSGSQDELTSDFQLWINLQAKFKMIEPQYQEIKKELIAEAKQNGVLVCFIAGEALGVKGPIYTITPAFFLNVKLNENSEFLQKISLKCNSIRYIHDGQGIFAGQNANQHQVVHLDINDKGEILKVKTGQQKCHLIIIAGEPINEPFVQHRPFVMNTKEEIQQAFQDYYDQKNGFEGSSFLEIKNLKSQKKVIMIEHIYYSYQKLIIHSFIIKISINFLIIIIVIFNNETYFIIIYSYFFQFVKFLQHHTIFLKLH